MLLDHWYFSYAICEKVVMFFLDCVLNCQLSKQFINLEFIFNFYVLQFCKSCKPVQSPVKFWSQLLIILTLLSLN